MKGPMTTQTLRGLNGLDPFHWRGDRTNFTHFNVAFPGLMGSSSFGRRGHGRLPGFYQHDCLRAESQPKTGPHLSDELRRWRRGGRQNAFSSPTTPALGQTALQMPTPAISGPPGSGSRPPDHPRAGAPGIQDFKVPQLRAIYQKMNFNSTSNAATVGGSASFTTEPIPRCKSSSHARFLRSSATTPKSKTTSPLSCNASIPAPRLPSAYTRTVVATTSTQPLSPTTGRCWKPSCSEQH